MYVLSQNTVMRSFPRKYVNHVGYIFLSFYITNLFYKFKAASYCMLHFFSTSYSPKCQQNGELLMYSSLLGPRGDGSLPGCGTKPSQHRQVPEQPQNHGFDQQTQL